MSIWSGELSHIWSSATTPNVSVILPPLIIFHRWARAMIHNQTSQLCNYIFKVCKHPWNPPSFIIENNITLYWQQRIHVFTLNCFCTSVPLIYSSTSTRIPPIAVWCKKRWYTGSQHQQQQQQLTINSYICNCTSALSQQLYSTVSCSILPLYIFENLDSPCLIYFLLKYIYNYGNNTHNNNNYQYHNIIEYSYLL